MFAILFSRLVTLQADSLYLIIIENSGFSGSWSGETEDDNRHRCVKVLFSCVRCARGYLSGKR